MNQLLNRRAVVAGSAATIMSAQSLFASTATPEDHDHHDHDHDDDHDHDHELGSEIWLLVNDSESASVSIWNAGDHTHVGDIDGVVVNGHAGTIPLTDGTVLLFDDHGQRLMQIGVHDGTPEILQEVAIKGHVAHIAIDSDHAHYCAVGTNGEDAHQLFLVDLESWEATPIALPEAGEVGLAMTHDALFHRNSNLNQFEAYDVHDLLQGTVEIRSTVAIGVGGHGEAINAETGEVLSLTDDGVDIAYFEETALTFGKTLAWPDAVPAARGYFARLINDGNHLLTYTADRSAAETEWSTWKNSALIYDMASGEPIVIELPDGYTFRYAMADHLAVFTIIGGERDQIVSIDIDPKSQTFGTIVTTADLTAMTVSAATDEPFYEVGAFRASAITPEGDAFFVSRGGDGIVDVLNPNTGDMIAEISVKTPLTGGGTLAVFGTAVPFMDTIGR